jgi:crotonobetainyl-CoA:carnitine CoA-transferase CaiB-like acyl-CoA transferase
LIGRPSGFANPGSATLPSTAGRPSPPIGTETVTTGPLRDTLVLDLGRVVAAPTCAFYLASLGATVIRIEGPGGDVSWSVPPYVSAQGLHRGPRGPRDIPLGHIKRGRGKRSVVLDLRREEGRGLFARLAERADVVVENFRPGVLDGLGVGYRAIAPANPGLIWCAISGFGQEGPDRDTQAMDLVVQARSGMMSKTGFPDGPPTKAGFTAGDQVPAVFATLAVVAALRDRDRSGAGAFLDIAMLDVLASLIWDEPLDLYEEEGRPFRHGNADPRGAPHNVYPSANGWIAIVCTTQRQWVALCGAMERPELAVELDSLAARNAASDRVNAAVTAWTAGHDSAWIDQRLLEAEVPAAAVRPPAAGRSDPALIFRKLFEPLGHPDRPGWVSPYVGPRMPIAVNGSPPETAPAEPLGASTDAVLSDLLGLTADQLAALHARGVIHSEEGSGEEKPA